MMGFKGRVTTIGVDLGTTLSVVGVSMGNGKVVIVTDKEGRRLFPSVVSYDATADRVYACYDAMKYLQLSPANTIYNAKRFIGRSLEEPVVSSYAASHPYKVVSAANITEFSEIGFEVQTPYQKEQRNKTKVVSAEEVGSEVIRYLLRVTATFMGHGQVNKAVIAVPAKFSQQQRAATGLAFKKAGLKVIRVLEEPTAAAVAYRLHKKSDIHHILVYDFGGGTLDVSLLYVSRGSVQVYATDGDETLGGSDLDVCLYNIIQQKLMKLQDGPACSPATVRVISEEIKKDLSYNSSVTFSCQPVAAGAGAPLGNITFEVTRANFEVGCSDLFTRALVPVDRLLAELQMDRKDVDEVVLVGGTTRVPRVKQQLRDYFGKGEANHTLAPLSP